MFIFLSLSCRQIFHHDRVTTKQDTVKKLYRLVEIKMKVELEDECGLSKNKWGVTHREGAIGPPL